MVLHDVRENCNGRRPVDRRRPRLHANLRNMSGSSALRTRASQTAAKPKRGAKPKAAASQRSSTYRGESRAAAEAAYHADAAVMARMGYIPTSEDWANGPDHVLEVGYADAPDRAPAVLAALEATKSEAAAKAVVAAKAEATAKAEHAAKFRPTPASPGVIGQHPRWRQLEVPLALRLVLATIGGVIAGVATSLLLGFAFGETPDALILGGFGLLGLLFGVMFGLAGEDL